jgi:hypothetical protein
MSLVNISSLNDYLKNIVASQIKTTQSAYSNKYNVVNAVAITSKYMSINPNTGTISVTTSTGTILVPQPVINPIPVNTQTSFIQTENDQVSITSKGEEDTIITNVLNTITNIDDITNSGYTKNNSILNLYDSISSNFWNPQVNEGNANPYFYKLNYTFTGTNEIYKFAIKNNNEFPGFTNIRLYPTSNPSNYVDIQPATDTNNQYLTETVALLIDDNGIPFFNTNQITAEFTLNPSLQPNTFYQYGQAYGVIYNTNTLGLRAGNYVSTNTGGTGNKLEWSYSYLENQNTLTGTNNTSNNYLVSTDGTYRIAQNKSFYQWSTDGGVTYTKKTLEITSDMKSTPNGQYIIASNGTIGYVSSDYGNTFTSKILDSSYLNYPYFTSLYTGQYQMFVSNVIQTSSTTIQTSVYKSEDYGVTFVPRTASYNIPNSAYNGYIINVIEKIDGTVLVVLNTRYVSSGGEQTSYGVVVYATQSAGGSGPLTTSIPFSSGIPTVIYALEQNYSNDSNEGQYKTAFGFYNFNALPYFYGEPCFFVTTNDGATPYTLYKNQSIFPEYYSTILTNPALWIQIRNSYIKISNDGSKQVAIVQWRYVNTPSLPDLITSYYSIDSGSTWNKSSVYPSLINSFSNIVAISDFSLIQVSGGYYYSYNGQYRTDPISYISTDYGNTWIVNSSINPASSIVYTNFYTAKTQTNSVYFQIKDINQNQVLGVSDNGFNMTKDLRVNNHSAYILGGTLTVGPDEASGLLNDYTANIDGTVSARNIVLLSDERFKNVIGDIDRKEAYDDVNKLKIIKYKFKDRPDDDRIYTGMIAQQVREIINNAVDINTSTYETPEGIINIKDTYSINYTTIISYLISSLQYTNLKLNLLEEKIKLKLNI